jgi:membrane-associated phospholipid phosphatase
MSNLRTRTFLAAFLLAGSAAVAQTPAPAAPEPERTTVDRPTQLPALVWGDALAVASSPWRWAPEDWNRLAWGSAVVVGTALLLDRPVHNAVSRNNDGSYARWGNNLEPIGIRGSLAAGGALYIYGLAAKDGEARATGADVLTSMAIAGVIMVPLKYGLGRARPDDNLGSTSFKPFSSRDSFPSGHTTFAFTAAAAITEHYSEPWVQVTAYGLATLTGLSRMALNVHWASDVVAGALLGTTVGKAVSRINQRKRHSQQSKVRFILEPAVGLGYQGLRAGLVF